MQRREGIRCRLAPAQVLRSTPPLAATDRQSWLRWHQRLAVFLSPSARSEQDRAAARAAPPATGARPSHP
eukprot:scaffold9285_cov121-Isochrysis_galbana.AAC.3